MKGDSYYNFSFLKVNQKIKPPKLSSSRIIFKNVNVEGKFQPLYKDPLYYQFTEYNDPSFLALTEDEFFHKA